jgi:hypothetical protein
MPGDPREMKAAIQSVIKDLMDESCSEFYLT